MVTPRDAMIERIAAVLDATCEVECATLYSAREADLAGPKRRIREIAQEELRKLNGRGRSDIVGGT
jgi:hypothetical protein